MIELNQLEQLIYIAENKTISKAAKELLISQPALSRSMQRLESDLGVELFDHYKNKIVLNKNGELAVKHAQKIIKSIQTMINDVQDYNQSFHRISIATCSPAPMWDIEPLIKELYPQITIQTAVINQKDLITKLKEKIGDKKALCALSGGVDSSVAAVLLSRAIGKNLTCIFVDHGLLRKNEGDEVEEVFKNQDINFIRVDAKDRFLAKLAGVSDPERKRKIIGEEFIRVFEEEAKKIGAVDFLVQGTIYPDVIESGLGKSSVIKSHHNVGGLPDYVDFKEIVEPLRDLFKDEVRKTGLELGMPENLVFRQPFPGPGLAIRVIGDITEDKLDILRDADSIFREEIANAGLHKSINQYFAVLTNLKSVGVMGDERTYDYTVALRAVETTDFMTGVWSKIPYEVLEKVSSRIVNEVKHVNRVCYDITSKPPATIEWE